jgi:hypothetical protein
MGAGGSGVCAFHGRELDDSAAAGFGICGIVRDEQDGETESLRAIEDQLADLFAKRRIQVGEGFVEQKGAWLREEHPHQCNAYSLPAG